MREEGDRFPPRDLSDCCASAISPLPTLSSASEFLVKRFFTFPHIPPLPREVAEDEEGESEPEPELKPGDGAFATVAARRLDAGLLSGEGEEWRGSILLLAVGVDGETSRSSSSPLSSSSPVPPRMLLIDTFFDIFWVGLLLLLSVPLGLATLPLAMALTLTVCIGGGLTIAEAAVALGLVG